MFRLDGQRISERQTGGSNNVDIRDGISVGGRDRIVVGATSPRGSRIDLFELDAASGRLLDIAEVPIDTTPEVRDVRLLLLSQRADRRPLRRLDRPVGPHRAVAAVR